MYCKKTVNKNTNSCLLKYFSSIDKQLQKNPEVDGSSPSCSRRDRTGEAFEQHKTNNYNDYDDAKTPPLFTIDIKETSAANKKNNAEVFYKEFDIDIDNYQTFMSHEEGDFKKIPEEWKRHDMFDRCLFEFLQKIYRLDETNMNILKSTITKNSNLFFRMFFSHICLLGLRPETVIKYTNLKDIKIINLNHPAYRHSNNILIGSEQPEYNFKLLFALKPK